LVFGFSFSFWDVGVVVISDYHPQGYTMTSQQPPQSYQARIQDPLLDVYTLLKIKIKILELIKLIKAHMMPCKKSIKKLKRCLT
jgi:hypothetical protein